METKGISEKEMTGSEWLKLPKYYPKTMAKKRERDGNF
jgi:hypothetical protein